MGNNFPKKFAITAHKTRDEFWGGLYVIWIKFCVKNYRVNDIQYKLDFEGSIHWTFEIEYRNFKVSIWHYISSNNNLLWLQVKKANKICHHGQWLHEELRICAD